jgi:hypothetical protein
MKFSDGETLAGAEKRYRSFNPAPRPSQAAGAREYKHFPRVPLHKRAKVYDRMKQIR